MRNNQIIQNEKKLKLRDRSVRKKVDKRPDAIVKNKDVASKKVSGGTKIEQFVMSPKEPGIT